MQRGRKRSDGGRSCRLELQHCVRNARGECYWDDFTVRGCSVNTTLNSELWTSRWPL